MLGEVAALAAAVLWALATLLFGQLGKSLLPLGLNLAKGAIALLLLALTLLVLGRPPAGLEGWVLVLLLASGGVGIGLGDTVYFAAINHLGARRALLMETLAPALAALLAAVGLGEVLSWSAYLGMALTLAGVGWVISQRLPPTAEVTPSPGYRGILYGVLAALGQASGAVLSRAALADTSVDPLWSSLLRLVGGVLLITTLLASQGQLRHHIKPLESGRVLALVAVAAVLGTYLGIYLQQIALKYSPTGVAQALTATSPLFILPMAVLVGDRVTGRAVGGAVVALVGVVLLVNG
ncbi:MAG: EamA family transporter [Cyanobacteriota bacterium]|nr:EamA family transporter [Cyanobacteriota bacterium]